MTGRLRHCLAAEAAGTAFLLAAVVGSGIMAERLGDGNDGLALLANALATGGALLALIVAFGPISGAHFNPAVTLMFALRRQMPWRDAAGYMTCQTAGALAGVAAAHGMFGAPLFSASSRARATGGEVFSESIATLGLVLIVLATRTRANAAPFAVAGYIVGAYWFTASTSFANPAVTLARAWTDTFAGIRPTDVPAFIGAQLAGALAAMAFWSWCGAGREQSS
jgi:glycerol uptake facilitator-like aquaporin